MKTILIIEDDKFLRELISHKLAGAGYKVEEAIDGEDGLKKAKSQKSDLILLDLILPGIDGFEVLRALKNSPGFSCPPVVVLSNLGQQEDIEKGMKLGAADYLIKAYLTPQEIIDKIKNIIA